MTTAAPAAPVSESPTQKPLFDAGATPAGSNVPPPAASGNAPVPDSPPGAGQVPEPTPPPSPTVKDRVAALGFSDVNDDSEATSRLIEAYELKAKQEADLQKQLRDAEVMAALARQMFPNGVPQGMQQAAPAATTPTQQQQNDWWTPPAYDPELAARFREERVDATGKKSVGWKAGTPAELIAAEQAHAAYMEDWAQKLVTNPKEALRGFAQEIRQQAVQEAIQRYESQHQTVQQQQAEAQAFERIRKENEAWLYQIDPVNKTPRRNPDGTFVFTPDGAKAQATLAQYCQQGMAPQQAWEIVAMQRELEQLRAGKQSATAQATNQQLKDQLLLAGAGRVPSAAGSIPPPTLGSGSQNPNLSLKDKLRQQMALDGTMPN